MAPIGMAPVPYFMCGLLATIGLLYIGWTLYWNQNTMQLGMKDIDVILPVYSAPVWTILAVGVLVGVTNIVGLLVDELYTSLIKWWLYRFVAEGVAIFLMHNGIGARALFTATICGFAWATISTAVPLWLYLRYGYESYATSAITAVGGTLVFYSILYILPRKLLHRRPAMVSYAFWNVIVLALFIAVLAMLMGTEYLMTSCAVEIMLSMCWMVQPFIILQAIRRDSLFWQGLSTNPQYEYTFSQFFGFSSSSSAHQNGTHGDPDLNEPLLGIWDIGRDTMGLVADSITTLEKKVVPIIPFGFIQIDTSRFASGGTARVYKGKYRSHEVAVKLLFCLELTPERVDDFCAEATLLNSLQHDNVVRCLGVSVMPPAICLVTEFCQYGSLYDFLHTTSMVISEMHEPRGSQNTMNSSAVGGDSGAYHDRSLDSSSSAITNVTPWASTDGGDPSPSERGSIGSTSSSREGSFNAGSYNTNNSKHAKAILQDLPDIVEGSEYSFDVSDASSIATTTTGGGFNSTVRRTDRIGGSTPGVGGLSRYNIDTTARSSAGSEDMATALARATKPAPHAQPGTSGARNSDGLINNSGSLVQSTTIAGSSYGPSSNVRRRLDSAEYYIERAPVGSLTSHVPRGRARTGSDKESVGGFLQSEASTTGPSNHLTTSLLSESALLVGNFGVNPALVDGSHHYDSNNSSGGGGGGGGSGGSGGDRVSKTNPLRRISTVMTEDGIGCGPVGLRELASRHMSLSKESSSSSSNNNTAAAIPVARNGTAAAAATIPASDSYLSFGSRASSGSRQPLRQSSSGSGVSGIFSDVDEDGNDSNDNDASSGDERNPLQLQQYHHDEEDEDIEAGVRRHSGGGKIRANTGSSERSLAMRPSSPIDANSSRSRDHALAQSTTTSSNSSMNAGILGALHIPARVRLPSGGTRDASATYVSAFLASSSNNRDSTGSSGVGYRSSTGNIVISDSPPPTQATDHSAVHASPLPAPAATMSSWRASKMLVMPISLRLRMCKDCVSGVAYLHANGFMHCDIKSLNFLVDSDLNVKLSDLGEARANNQGSQQDRLFPSNINWSAPEVLSEQVIITYKADIWSLAMVIVEILTGEVPFDTAEWRALRMDEFLGRLESGNRPYIPASISDQFPWLTALIHNAWQFDPIKRCDSIEMLTIFTDQLDRTFGYQMTLS